MFENIKPIVEPDGDLRVELTEEEMGLKYVVCFNDLPNTQLLSRVFAVPQRKMAGRKMDGWADCLRYELVVAEQHLPRPHYREYNQWYEQRYPALELTLHSVDTGNCRIYYKNSLGLYCFQLDGRWGALDFHLYACTPDGEPSHKVEWQLRSLKSLPDGHLSALARDFLKWLEEQ